MSAAARQRRYRQRLREGAFVVTLEIEADLVIALEDATGVEIEDAGAAANAIARILARLGENVTRNAAGDRDVLDGNHDGQKKA